MSTSLPLILTSLMLTSSGCATSTESTLFGISIGGVLGAGVGAAAGQNNGVPREGAAVGLAVGSALGGLMGYLKHKQNEDQKNKAVLGTASAAPILSKPSVERVWVGPRIENNTYVEGHYQFVIKKPSRWAPDSVEQKSTSSAKAAQK